MQALWSGARASLAGNALAVAGLAAVTLLSLPGLGSGWYAALCVLLVAIWFAFAAEFVLAHAGRRRHASFVGDRAAMVDVLTIAVPLLAVLPPPGGMGRWVFCAIWILRPLREVSAFRLVLRVLSNEARNLFGVMAIFGIILFLASMLAWLVERGAQPVAFGSIPDAMWWAITTLTTTGYGDAIPQSVIGRLLAGVVMMCGIGVFALWAGILATGFSEELRRQDFTQVWQLVSGVPMFEHIPHRDLAEIVRALKPRRIPAGSTIFRKGQPGTEMFFILEGHVRVSADRPVDLGPGDFFGEMALVSGGPRLATITATTPLLLLALHISDFELLIDRDAGVAEKIRQTAEVRRQAQPGG